MKAIFRDENSDSSRQDFGDCKIFRNGRAFADQMIPLNSEETEKLPFSGSITASIRSHQFRWWSHEPTHCRSIGSTISSQQRGTSSIRAAVPPLEQRHWPKCPASDITTARLRKNSDSHVASASGLRQPTRSFTRTLVRALRVNSSSLGLRNAAASSVRGSTKRVLRFQAGRSQA